MIKYLLIFITSLCICAWVTPLIRKMALKLKVIDRPRARKIHTRVITRLGGVAIYISFFITAFTFLFFNSQALKDYIPQFIGLFISSTLVFSLGIYDDFRGTNAYHKFALQILAAVILISFGIKISILTNPFGDTLSLNWLSVPITIFWILFITNAINLIDGLDGLAAGVSSIISLTLFLVAFHRQDVFVACLSAALAGSTIGFLKYNFNPAKIFMGDSGSLFLGFTLATIAIQGSQKSVTMAALLIPIISMGYPVIDTILAIIRRGIKRTHIFRADEEHIHHKLLKKGLNHKWVVLIIYVISICLGIIAFFFTMMKDQYVSSILFIMSLVVFVTVTKLGLIEFKRAKK